MSLEITTKEDLLSRSNNYMVLDLPVLMRGYATAVTKTSSEYMQGSFETKGSVQFKAWGGSDAFRVLSSVDLVGKICLISGKVNEYGGSKSIIVEYITVPEDTGGLKDIDFYEAKYDVEKYISSLEAMLDKECGVWVKDAWNILIDENTRGRFKEEFAATYYHDNCAGGLLAHTYKMMRISTIIKSYPELRTRLGYELVLFACAIHDIGKVMEYSTGVMSDIGVKVSHPILGCLMMESKKEELLNLMSEDVYYSLISVIGSHHGEYGEAPRTLLAHTVHLIDKFESSLQLLNQKVEETPSAKQFVVDSYKLS